MARLTSRLASRLMVLLLGLLLLSPAASAAPLQRLEAGQVLRGRFVQERHLQGFNAPLRSEGRFVLVPGRGLIWQAEKPFATTTVITAQGLRQDIGGAEATRLSAARMPFLARLYEMLGGALAGDWQALEQEFTVEHAGDDAHWRITMKPRRATDLAMPFRSIEVSGGRFVEEVRLAKEDGDFDQLSFVDQALSAGSPTADEAAQLNSLGQ